MAGLTHVETDRLILRLPEPDDAAAFTRLITPEISRWLGSWPVPFYHDRASRKIADCRAAAAADKQLPLVITRRADGEILGWLAIGRNPDIIGRGVLSYWLGDAFHRQGILRAAATAAIAAARVHMGITSLEATCHLDNAASAGALRALGLRPIRDGMLWIEARQTYEPVTFFEDSP